jgi:hypothetical protein
MNDIIVMAQEAGIADAFLVTPHPGVVQQLERLVELARADERDRATRENAYVLAERNKLAQWMMAQGYATGHGDTTEELLKELEREIGFDKAELWLKRINDAVLAEREACAAGLEDIAEEAKKISPEGFVWKTIQECAAAIRARGQA